MGLVDAIRRETEQRTIGGVPWAPWNSPYFGGKSSFSIGGPRSPTEALQDQDGVLGLAACFAATRHIADTIASLSIKTYRRLPNGTSQLLTSSMLLGDAVAGGGPQADGTLYDWIFSATAACLLHGTAVGLITNRAQIANPSYPDGLPTGIAWLNPERITIMDDDQMPEDTRRARIYYRGALMERRELVLLRAYVVPGRLAGISPIKAHALLFAQGKAQLDFSNSWFRAGGFPPGTFSNISEEVDDTQAKQIKQRLADAIRKREPLVHGRDWVYSPINVPAEEASFILAQQLSATQIAAIYGVPPWRCGGTKGDSMTYSSQIQDQVDELTNTFRPWLTRWEHLLTSLLPASQYAKFDTDDLLRVDPATRSTIRQAQRQNGLRTVNELRAEDDRPPVAGGDDPIPESVLISLARGSRAIPKSLEPLVSAETDHTAELLQQIEASNPELVTESPKPPVPIDAEAYLGQQIASGRSNMTAAQLLTELRSHYELEAGTDG